MEFKNFLHETQTKPEEEDSRCRTSTLPTPGERGGEEWKAEHTPLAITIEGQLEAGERGEEKWKALEDTPLSITIERELKPGGRRIGEEWNALLTPRSIHMESQLESGARRGEDWKALHSPPLSLPMETQLESGGRIGEEWNILHGALKQEYACLSWGERYKIALEMATSLAFLHPHETFIHPHGHVNSSEVLMGSQDTAKRECVEGFGKFLYALISGKQSGAAKLPCCIVGDGGRLGRAEYVAYKAALWLRRHTIPPLPWACPLRRYYILNGDDLDKRMRNEIMASGRAIVQLGTALRVVMQCTQQDPGSRPTMPHVCSTLTAAHSSHIPFSLTAALKIGFPLYRSFALLLYFLLFLYVGIYKTLGLIVYYLPYAFGASYHSLDALLLLLSLFALFCLLLRTVSTLNGLDDVLFLD